MNLPIGEKNQNLTQQIPFHTVGIQNELQEKRVVTLYELERSHIRNTLETLKGNKSQTARALGISLKTLYNKLHSYGDM